MSLRFNYQKLMTDYKNKLRNYVEMALDSWEMEARHFARNEVAGGTPEFNSYVSIVRNNIIGYLEANIYALVDAYGTGSLMDTENNPDFESYFKSKLWNPARTNKVIVGRPAGNYTDIFGRPKTTTGVFKGKPLEGMKFNGYEIRPINPSKSIKIANDLLEKTYLPRVYNYALDALDFSNYIIEVN